MSDAAPHRQLAVLGYHKVGPPPAGGWESWYYVPAGKFADQLAYLRAEGWEFVNDRALLRGLANPAHLPRRTALVTFDDGYRSNLEVAVPVLERLACPAVMFVPTDYIGGRNTFDGGAEPDEPICSWDELRELRRRGVSVQSHGTSHRGFSDLTPAEREAELWRSRAALEDGLGAAVDLFAFPFGDGGPKPDRPAIGRALEQAGYRAAFLYPGGQVTLPASDVYRLTRIAVGADTDLRSGLPE